MTQLIPSKSGGTATREGGFRGTEAGIVKVRMPELYFVDVFWENRTRVQRGLRTDDVDNSLRQGL